MNEDSGPQFRLVYDTGLCRKSKSTKEKNNSRSEEFYCSFTVKLMTQFTIQL